VSSDPKENEPDAVLVSAPAEDDPEPEKLVSGHLHWRNIFRAFRHRNYRLFFAGMTLSLIGTWMQNAAEGWLVYELTNSEFHLGLTRFLHSIPVTLFTLIGGHLADHFSKRRILITTQLIAMSLALTLGGLALTGIVQFWHIAALAMALGLAQAFDIPARQSFIVEIVGKKDLMNAIAMNASMFNGARVIGPALAGLLIAWPGVGVAGCFFLNGFSFLAVIVSYLLLKLPPSKPPATPRSIKSGMSEALKHVRGDRVLLTFILLVATFSLFGWPYTVLMPAIARDALGVGAGGYGALMSANGAGALLGALTVASLGDYPNKKRVFFVGAFGFSVTVACFAQSAQFWLTAAVLGRGLVHAPLLLHRQHHRATPRSRRTPRPHHGHLLTRIHWTDAFRSPPRRRCRPPNRRCIHAEHWSRRLRHRNNRRHDRAAARVESRTANLIKDRPKRRRLPRCPPAPPLKKG